MTAYDLGYVVPAPVITKTEDGYQLTIPGLTDFELHADTEAELRADLNNALLSHLKAYQRAGKSVPFFRVPQNLAETAGGPPVFRWPPEAIAAA